jgi:hypothetical protein
MNLECRACGGFLPRRDRNCQDAKHRKYSDCRAALHRDLLQKTGFVFNLLNGPTDRC